MSSASNADRVLTIENLTVDFRGQQGITHAVRGLSLEAARGEIVAVVGESGSGKSVTAMSVMGLLPPTAERSGRILLEGQDLGTLDEKAMRAVRGSRIGMVFQDPMRALNPVYTVGWQVAEAIRLHAPTIRKQDLVPRATELLRRAGIPQPERRLGQYPHELSGGLRQRVMIAIAIANEPALLIADEATTALDVTVQAEILDLLRHMRDQTGMAMLVITHNMGVVADVADRVVVMRAGRCMEQASVGDLFSRPQDPYTAHLLSSVPRLARHPRRTPAAGVSSPNEEGTKHEEPKRALEFEDVVIEFGRRSSRLRAVDRVSLSVEAGQIVGLVGESGSGKSTLGRAAVGLYRPTSGTVRIDGRELSMLRRRSLRTLRRHCSIVMQDPGSSLDPRMTIAQSIAEPMVINGVGSRRERRTRVLEVLDQVRLGPAFAARYPHQMSGGQLQRASIARALVLQPSLLIADEPTSALDVSVQASVLEVLLQLQQDSGFACLFITHDLAVVSMLADRVVVMHQGRIVEQGDREQVLFEPSDAYTRRLVGASPVPDAEEQRRRRVALASEAS